MAKEKIYNEVITIDCHYVREKLTASYLIKNGKSGIIIETGHGRASRHIIAAIENNGLRPDEISHIFITHVHLDHCGGLSSLLKYCSNAVVICHPRAKRHLVDPGKLIQGSIMVYGEPLFKSLYGIVEPVLAEKIQTVEDNEIIKINSHEFSILHTMGHARHHICVHDIGNNTIYTGDTFGLAYPDFQLGSRKFIYPATTPTDFDLPEARKSIQRIHDLRVDTVWLTHFGQWNDIDDGANQLFNAMNEIEKFKSEALDKGYEGKPLQDFCYEKFKTFIGQQLQKRGLNLTSEQWKIFDYDIRINSMGIAHSISKQQKDSATQIFKNERP